MMSFAAGNAMEEIVMWTTVPEETGESIADCGESGPVPGPMRGHVLPRGDTAPGAECQWSWAVRRAMMASRSVRNSSVISRAVAATTSR